MKVHKICFELQLHVKAHGSDRKQAIVNRLRMPTIYAPSDGSARPSIGCMLPVSSWHASNATKPRHRKLDDDSIHSKTSEMTPTKTHSNDEGELILGEELVKRVDGRHLWDVDGGIRGGNVS